MFSPIKTIIANLSDKPCRLNLSERSLYIASPKGRPNSIIEIDGDVFSRFDSNVEAEAFLAYVLKGTITLSYSLDERFVCTGCPENSNMKTPARFRELYKNVKTEDKQPEKTEDKQLENPEDKQLENPEDKQLENTQDLEEKTVDTTDKTESTTEFKQEEHINENESSQTEVPVTEIQTNEVVETLVTEEVKETTSEDKPKRSRKIKVQ